MPTQIAIAVVELDGCFLVGRRPAGVVLAGCDEFPGGKVEPGESPAAAAVRECQEETGLLVEVLRQYPAAVHDYSHDRVHLHFFACRPASPAEVPPPIPPYRWVTREQLGGLQFPAGNSGLLQLLLGESPR